MRKFLLSTFLFLSTLAGLKAQNIDSLLRLLEKPAPMDSASISQYNFAAFDVHTVYPDLCERLAQKALEGAEKIGDRRGTALAKTCIGLAEWIRHNVSKAMSYFFEAIEVHEELGNKAGMAAVNSNLGMLYDELEDYDLALKYYAKSLDLLEQIGKQSKMATTFANIGVAYKKKNQPDSALKYYFKALELRREEKDNKSISGLYNNIAVVYYRHFNQKEKALSYYNKALEIKIIVKDTYGLANTYRNMANIHNETGNIAYAKELYQKAFLLADSIDSKMQKTENLFELSNIARKEGDLSSALDYQKDHYETKLIIAKEQKGDEIKQLELSHDLKKKEDMLTIVNRELEISQSQQALEVQRRNILLIILFFSAILGLALFKWQRARTERARTKEALMKVELENVHLREEELKKELEFKNRELTSYTINFLRKNQLMEDLQSISESLAKPASTDAKDDIRKLDRLIRQSHSVDKDWRDFKAYFEGVHPKFFKELNILYPDLTNAEVKLCALIRLNMNSKEVSEVLSISPESVKTARYRLRKKLKIEDSNENLNQFVGRIGEQLETI